MTLHYASGDVNDQGLDPAAAAAGFNMADVSDAETLNSLPAGVKGLYYLDKAEGVTADFVAQMNAIKGSANLFGVYLADEPDPSNVSAADLKAESDWIHANMPGVKTFIVADNQGSNTQPDFHDYYTQASTDIDLWGLDVYPFRTEIAGGGNVNEVDLTVAAAESQIGISASQIVPVFQAFGGGSFSDGDNGKWSMPTPAQEQALMAEWAKFAPNPSFDYAYSWMQQEGDESLSSDAALLQVFHDHNLATGSGSSSEPSSPTGPTGSTGSTGSTGGTSPTGQTIQGDGGRNRLVGGPGNDTLEGFGGNDTLNGEGGHDILVGGSGRDTFVFTESGNANSDVISDFQHGTDRIALDRDTFTALTGPVHLSLGSQAVSSNDHLIYNQQTGNLFYDPDGVGGTGQSLIANLAGSPTLTASDIRLI